MTLQVGVVPFARCGNRRCSVLAVLSILLAISTFRHRALATSWPAPGAPYWCTHLRLQNYPMGQCLHVQSQSGARRQTRPRRPPSLQRPRTLLRGYRRARPVPPGHEHMLAHATGPVEVGVRGVCGCVGGAGACVAAGRCGCAGGRRAPAGPRINLPAISPNLTLRAAREGSVRAPTPFPALPRTHGENVEHSGNEAPPAPATRVLHPHAPPLEGTDSELLRISCSSPLAGRRRHPAELPRAGVRRGPQPPPATGDYRKLRQRGTFCNNAAAPAAGRSRSVPRAGSDANPHGIAAVQPTCHVRHLSARAGPAIFGAPATGTWPVTRRRSVSETLVLRVAMHWGAPHHSISV